MMLEIYLIFPRSNSSKIVHHYLVFSLLISIPFEIRQWIKAKRKLMDGIQLCKAMRSGELTVEVCTPVMSIAQPHMRNLILGMTAPTEVKLLRSFHKLKMKGCSAPREDSTGASRTYQHR